MGGVDGRRPRAAQRVGVVAALAAAGAGAGLIAATATVASAWARSGWAVLGGAAGMAGAMVWDQVMARQAARARALERRGAILAPLRSDQARWGGEFAVLAAGREVAPFRGRQADLAWLRQWCQDAGGRPVRVLAGPAGVGKTRLAVQFARELPGLWIAGWLKDKRGSEAIAAVAACGDPALILVDDADARTDVLGLLQDLADYNGPSLVRVLLITRAAGLAARLRVALAEPSCDVVDPRCERVMEPQGNAEDCVRWYQEAVRGYAAALRTPPPDLPTVVSAAWFDEGEPMLAVQARALLTVLETRNARPLTRVTGARTFDQVADLLFEHEQRRWHATAAAPHSGLGDLTDPAQVTAIAALILCAPADEEAAAAVLCRLSDLFKGAPAERLANIVQWAQSLYPGNPPWPIRLQPSMLAGWFLTRQITRAPAIASLLGQVTAERSASLLALFAAASDHLPDAVHVFARLAGDLMTSRAGLAITAAQTASTGRRHLDAELARLIYDSTWTVDTLTPARDQAGDALPRTQAALAAAEVGLARAGGPPADLAAALDNLGTRLDRLGRYEEALAATEDSLALYRSLPADDPANPAIQSDLGRVLYHLGVRLDRLGRYQEALAATEDSLALYRSLPADDPAIQSDLAACLSNLGVRFSALGRYQDALPVTEEAVAIRRNLAAANPGGYRIDLARSLTNLGVQLENLGCYQSALTAVKESVALFRPLAAGDPAVQNDLGLALDKLGNQLGNLGSFQDAVDAARESVALRRPLAAGNAAIQNDLANALNDLCIHLHRQGRFQDARAAIEESVALRRPLAVGNPAIQNAFGLALTNLGSVLDRLGCRKDALAAAEESVTVRRPLAADSPAIQNDLARSLDNLSIHLDQQGRYQDALAAAEESVNLWRELATIDPGQYQATYNRHDAQLRRRLRMRRQDDSAVTPDSHSP
jgi:tetratricopeptide (TPR) repeat protein